MKRWVAALATAAAAAGVGLLTYRRRINAPFEPTHFVWSRGLALLCDHNGGVDFVKRQAGGRPALRFDPEQYAHIREGDLVWVRHIALPQFLREVLPRVKVRFGLVTGDEDWGIPKGYPDASTIVNSDKVAHWFTQNFDGTDPSGRISGIPIGLDFHTISNRRKWGHWPQSPRAQEADLQALRARVLPTAARRLAVHADFHFNKHKHQVWGQTRGSVETQLRTNPLVEFQTRKLRRIDSWAQKSGLAFVASPHGNGLDCHRTWESLVLGHIVIVCRSSLDPLYEGLPVVIVDDWSEITRPNLERWLEQHGSAFGQPEVEQRLTNSYWITHMRRVLATTLDR